MYSIPRPAEDLQQILRDCVDQTNDRALKGRLQAEELRILQRSGIYLARAEAEELFTIAREDPVTATVADLRNLYRRVLVRGRGRPVYNRLLLAARLRRCPLCCQRDAQTLDHFLPESEFPEFSVLPLNLVPACYSCNKAKLDYVPVDYEGQTLHPYFDDWGEHTFLQADVDVGATVSVDFDVERPEGVALDVFSRVRSHFSRFELRELYAGHAAVELVQNKAIFRSTFQDGADALRSELEFIAESRRHPFSNAWEPALYRALANSDDFCNGGFEQIEE